MIITVDSPDGHYESRRQTRHQAAFPCHSLLKFRAPSNSSQYSFAAAVATVYWLQLGYLVGVHVLDSPPDKCVTTNTINHVTTPAALLLQQPQ